MIWIVAEHSLVWILSSFIYISSPAAINSNHLLYVLQYKLFFLDCSSWSHMVRKHVNEFPAVMGSFPIASVLMGERKKYGGTEVY